MKIFDILSDEIKEKFRKMGYKEELSLKKKNCKKEGKNKVSSDKKTKSLTSQKVIVEYRKFEGRRASCSKKDFVEQKKFQKKQINERSDSIPLTIGLDVGTSTTKVVIQNEDRNNFYLIDFENFGLRGQTYLLPTQIKKGPYGKYSLSNSNDEDSNIYKNIKINYFNLLNNYDKENKVCNEKFTVSKKILTEFCSLVIAYSINWFVKNYAKNDIFKKYNFDWSVNLGIPSDSFSKNHQFKDYKELLKLAVENAKKLLLEEASNRSSFVSEQLNVIPEILGAIQAYLKLNTTVDTMSESRLYCIIDIGAGTLDTCAFRLTKEENATEIYSFYKSSVMPLGTQFYLRALYGEYCSYDEVLERYINEKQILSKVDECAEKYIHSELSQKIQKSSLDNFFEKNCRTAIMGVIWQTRQKRDRYAEAWSTKLPIIICGGGSYLERYRTLIKETIHNELSKQLKHLGGKGVEIINLASIGYVTKLEPDQKRLIIAQGLSYPFNQFQKFQKENDIENMEENSTVEWEQNYIGKEQV